MAGGKRKYQSRKRPVRELLKEIDRAADAYVRNGYRDVVGRSYLRTPPSLAELLAELARYHPLSPVATRRGKRVLRKLQSGNDGGYDARRLEEKVRTAFQIRGRVAGRGALGRDVVRIAQSAAEPFEMLAAAICQPIVIIREIFRK